VRTTWRVLADHRDLRLVLSAGLISRSGDWILLVGLLYRVYAVTGSTVASALTMIASLVPQAVFGPIAGVFVDRWDRRRTMITANLLLAAGLIPLLAVRGAGQVWIVFLVMAWEGMVEMFFIPAQQALVPRLTPDDQLVAANALTGQVSDIARLAGSGLGGVIAATGGLAAVTLTDAAGFAASAVLLGFVRTSGRVERPAAGDTAAGDRAAVQRVRDIVSELRDGLGLAARHPFLRALLAYGLITSLGEGVMSTLFAPFVRSVLHGGNAGARHGGLARGGQPASDSRAKPGRDPVAALGGLLRTALSVITEYMGEATVRDVHEVAAALRIAVGMLFRKLRQIPSGDELTPAETSALSRLDRGGPATSSDLAKLDRISPQSMGATLAVLEQRGLLERRRDPGDGRRIVLSVTPAGRQVVNDRRSARTDLIAQALRGGFTPAELDLLHAAAPLLERLAEKL
jgi:DNA-binding MarR family transcriptional regulator/MFS family permease